MPVLFQLFQSVPLPSRFPSWLPLYPCHCGGSFTGSLNSIIPLLENSSCSVLENYSCSVAYPTISILGHDVAVNVAPKLPCAMICDITRLGIPEITYRNTPRPSARK